MDNIYVKRPREVGTRLLNLISGFGDVIDDNGKVGEISQRVEVELLIRAHICFLLACNINGVDLVLKIVHSRVQVYLLCIYSNPQGLRR